MSLLGHTDPDRTRRKLGGLSLIAAPLLLGAGEVLRLSTGSDGANLEVAGFTDDSEGVWIAVGILEIAGVIVVFPALSAFLHLFTRRAVSLGHLAVGFLVAGFVCWAAYAGLLASVNGAAASLTDNGDVKIGPASVVALEHANTLEGPLSLLGVVAAGALLVGLLALANAVWSSKLFPKWTAVTIAAAPILAFVVDYGFPYLLLVPAWGWMGWKVLRMSTGEWQLLGGTVLPAEPPAAVAEK